MARKTRVLSSKWRLLALYSITHLTQMWSWLGYLPGSNFGFLKLAHYKFNYLGCKQKNRCTLGVLLTHLGDGAYHRGGGLGRCHWLQLITRKGIYGSGGGGGGDLNGFRDIRPFMKWRGFGMPPGDPFKPTHKTSYPYLLYPQISEQSVQWLLRTHPDKIWTDFKMPIGDPLVSPFWILKHPKFQDNPSSGYWELIRRKFGGKKRKKK